MSDKIRLNIFSIMSEKVINAFVQNYVDNEGNVHDRLYEIFDIAEDNTESFQEFQNLIDSEFKLYDTYYNELIEKRGATPFLDSEEEQDFQEVNYIRSQLGLLSMVHKNAMHVSNLFLLSTVEFIFLTVTPPIKLSDQSEKDMESLERMQLLGVYQMLNALSTSVKFLGLLDQSDNVELNYHNIAEPIDKEVMN